MDRKYWSEMLTGAAEHNSIARANLLTCLSEECHKYQAVIGAGFHIARQVRYRENANGALPHIIFHIQTTRNRPDKRVYAVDQSVSFASLCHVVLRPAAHIRMTLRECFKQLIRALEDALCPLPEGQE